MRRNQLTKRLKLSHHPQRSHNSVFGRRGCLWRFDTEEAKAVACSRGALATLLSGVPLASAPFSGSGTSRLLSESETSRQSPGVDHFLIQNQLALRRGGFVLRGFYFPPWARRFVRRRAADRPCKSRSSVGIVCGPQGGARRSGRMRVSEHYGSDTLSLSGSELRNGSFKTT